MSTQPKMTEPQVLPAKPKVKPTPKREVKPAPRRKNDPWNVPAPKVNPTPKAENTKVMTKKKTLVKTIGQLDFCKSLLTKKQFDDKFILSDELISKLAAKEAMAKLLNTDRVMTAEELKSFGF